MWVRLIMFAINVGGIGFSLLELFRLTGRLDTPLNPLSRGEADMFILLAKQQ